MFKHAALVAVLVAVAAAAPLRGRAASSPPPATPARPMQPTANHKVRRANPTKACVGDRGSFDAGYGACSTYSTSNYNWCELDRMGSGDTAVYASQVCSECNACLDGYTSADDVDFKAVVSDAVAATGPVAFAGLSLFEVEVKNECNDAASHPFDVTFIATLSAPSLSRVVEAISAMVAMVPGPADSPAAQFATTIAGAAAALSETLGPVDDVFGGMTLKLIARPLHGMIKAVASTPGFFDMDLTATVQLHFLQLLTSAALGGAADSLACPMSSTGGFATPMAGWAGDTVETYGPGSNVAAGTAKANQWDGWQNSVGWAFTLTKGDGSSPDAADGVATEQPALSGFILDLMETHLPQVDSTPFEYALHVLDNVEFGLSFSGGSALTNLGGEFALPAPFSGSSSMEPGLTVKASIDASVLPPRNPGGVGQPAVDSTGLECNTVCEMMHQFFEETAGEGTESSTLALVGNLQVTLPDTNEAASKQKTGVEVAIKMVTENFSIELSPTLNLRNIEFGVSAKVSTDGEGNAGISTKGTITWQKPTPMLGSLESQLPSSTDNSQGYPYRNPTTNQVHFKGDEGDETFDGAYFTSYGGETIDFTGTLGVKVGVDDGKADAALDFDFAMNGMYMNALNSELVHFGDLKLAAGLTIKKPFVNKLSVGGRGCFGGLVNCVRCMETAQNGNAQCDRAINMVGYLNVAATNSYLYSTIDGEVSIGKLFEIAAPDLEFPGWLNVAAITGVARPTMQYNEESRQYEMQTSPTDGAQISFAAAETQIPYTAADGSKAQFTVPAGLVVSGGVTLFPDVPEIDWSASIEFTVGDIWSMVTLSDWSLTVTSDPIDFKVAGTDGSLTPVLSLYASGHSTKPNEERQGPKLQLSNKMDVMTNFFGGVGMAKAAITIPSELAALATAALSDP